ncbi:TetR/AcrR family transcriptional regulator [Labrys monachus]|uniref:AcrR family transcriptional regulator n=1 Tax=Labrys monachus TaxID=217067 RepID=A0ABU0FB58_9HYPH|nr:TetR/AcrR family transcriptional regulator [Labrys monachus]MDQ0391857.1 AcrR family transcriptional regulator [Labrys monachus]
MARPREFDRDEALKHATAVFWAKGFEGASTDDLLAAMKIGRQSLYDTFGDKRRLYLEALERYLAASVSSHVAMLESEASPLAGIRRMLMAFATGSVGSRALGCMGVGSISEFGQSDPEIIALNRSSALTLDAALVRALGKARSRGELAAGLDEKAAAHFIQATLLGLKVSGKAGLDAAALRQVVDVAMEALKRR